ncbi:Uncharacterised protein [Mycoplasmopsis citelli]|uniref:Uncharacterized protein n=1 Tax=Mycoplasmopsis citelli TaxID=171281 RepID=A0A449B140_9BACT|nr:hypothetical protein [Mycoplasmopsis citelli]VEU74296.1 Uncharacterised protein [Mycoplasmopsis citelli]
MEYLLKTDQLKIDYQIFEKIYTKRNAFVLHCLIDRYFDKNSQAKFLYISEARKLIFGDWNENEAKKLSKSSFYQALNDLIELNYIKVEDSKIYLQRPLHCKGLKYFSIKQEKILMQIGNINPRFLYFLLLGTKLANKNSLVKTQKRIWEGDEFDWKFKGQVWRRYKRITKTYQTWLSYGFYKLRGFKTNTIRLFFKSEKFAQLIKCFFNSWKIIAKVVWKEQKFKTQREVFISIRKEFVY